MNETPDSTRPKDATEQATLSDQAFERWWNEYASREAISVKDRARSGWDAALASLKTFCFLRLLNEDEEIKPGDEYFGDSITDPLTRKWQRVYHPGLKYPHPSEPVRRLMCIEGYVTL